MVQFVLCAIGIVLMTIEMLDKPLKLGASAGLSTMSPAMSEAKNYYGWIAETLRSAVGQRVLDVGGGTGSLLHYFDACQQRYALDISEDCVTKLQQLFSVSQNVQVVLGDIVEPAVQQQFLNAGIDSILCTNVLEHVEDDLSMLQAFHNILAPLGGCLGILVPAHQQIYGTMDQLAGHYRRYSQSLLLERLKSVGFSIEMCRYMNSVATLGWYLNGCLLKKQSLADENMNAQILAYDKFVIPMVRWAEKIIKPPIGLSVVAVAKAKLGS